MSKTNLTYTGGKAEITGVDVARKQDASGTGTVIGGDSQLAKHRSPVSLCNHAEQIVANIPIGFVVLDTALRIQQINHAVIRMFELDPAATYPSLNLSEILADHDLSEQICLVLKDENPSGDFTFDRLNSTGLRSYRADIAFAQMAEENVILFMVQDITVRKQSESEIYRLAFYDSLTGLPNRSLLQERLNRSMSHGARNGKYGALMCIDLDNFKSINDTLGHEIGDQLLKEVSTRLIEAVREGDIVARLGADEFVVVLDALSSDSIDASTQAAHVARKISTEISRMYLLNDIEINSCPSIGISMFRGHQNSLDEILIQADLAMSQSKLQGRNTTRFFAPEMQLALNKKVTLENELRAAIRKNQLMLYYQMQVDSFSQVLGAEVLLRWQHPEFGMVSPATFIPIAEESGMIIQIGDWVLDQACKQLKLWETDPAMRHIELAVNISPRQLGQSDFVERVKQIIVINGVDPSRLKLELTEGFILNDVDRAIEKMLELKSTGIRFSLDDFGTGYSSLSYLSRLPLNQIKIDQSFVRNITNDRNSLVMVKTIINIGQNFGMNLIAEGVETDAQLAYLTQYGCSEFQGYLFGKPVPLKDFECALKSRHPAQA